MNLGEYPPAPIVTLCGLLLFFLGFLAFQADVAAFVSLLVIVLLTLAMSYRNRTPLGGCILGLFTSTVFLLGYLLMGCVREVSQYGPEYRPEFHLDFLRQLLGFGEFGHIKWSMLSAVAALASIGLFFGVLGYVFEHISLRVSVTKPLVFRDYWSSVHLLGKSDTREYSDLDRKLSSWSFRKKGWWRRVVEKIAEPQPELVFSSHTKSSSRFSRGDLFDLSTGRMVGKDLIDPSYIISKYRPSVLKVAELPSSPKGVRRLALDRLAERFLGWFIPSNAAWIFYQLLSVFLVFLVYFFWTSNLAAYPYYEGAEVLAVSAAIIASVVTLLLVRRWRIASRELLERRPDERVLIFVVYAILALLYGFYFQVIINPPIFYIFGSQASGALSVIPEGWIGSWLVWTKWLLFLAGLLGLGYIWVHRECEVVNTYFYDNSPPMSGVSRVSSFQEPHDEPFWLKGEKVEAYWVLRFMYFWRYEIAKIPHPDWERIEVWVDAEKGTARWIVSDYHYRELWYKVEGNLPTLYVRFFMNFHTPVPIVNSAEAQSVSSLFTQKTRTLIGAVVTGKTPEIVEHLGPVQPIPRRWIDLHPSDWIHRFGLAGVAADFCSKLAWTYWRYSHGLENAQRYLEDPATRPQEQPIIK